MAMPRPKLPDGSDLSGSEAKIVRTLDGHRGINEHTDPAKAADQDWRRNERTFEEADLGGNYDV